MRAIDRVSVYVIFNIEMYKTQGLLLKTGN